MYKNWIWLTVSTFSTAHYELHHIFNCATRLDKWHHLHLSTQMQSSVRIYGGFKPTITYKMYILTTTDLISLCHDRKLLQGWFWHISLLCRPEFQNYLGDPILKEYVRWWHPVDCYTMNKLCANGSNTILPSTMIDSTGEHERETWGLKMFVFIVLNVE